MSLNLKLLIILLSCLVSINPVNGSTEKKSVAIVNFENITKNNELDWIGAGFSETLTTKLLEVNSLRVIERSQITKVIKEQELQITGLVDQQTLVKLGTLIGVQYLVLGSYQKLGENLLVNARLVEVETGEVKKAVSSKGLYLSLFDIQEELGLKLVNVLEAPITETEKEEMAKKPAENLDAYKWYAKGIDQYEKFNYDSAVRSFKEAIKINGDYVNALIYLGRIYDIKGLWNESITVYERAINISRAINDEKDLRMLYNNIGVVYVNKGNYDKAMEYYKDGLVLAEKTSDESILYKLYDNIGEIHRAKGQDDTAMEYYKKSLVLTEKLNDEAGIAGNYNNIGLIYLRKGDYDKAMEYFKKSAAVAEKLGLESIKSVNYENMGVIYHMRKDYDKAMEYYNKSLAINEKIGDKSGIADIYQNIGSLYSHKKDFDSAIEYYNKALVIREKIGDDPGLEETYHSMYAIYIFQGNTDEAIYYLEKCVEIECRLGLAKCEENKKKLQELKNK